MIDVSIVIVNYNTKQVTLDCIRSVKEKSQNLSYEIVLVDNASTDGTAEAVASEFGDVLVIRCSENIGFGRANNRGVEQAKGKYIFFLNSDTLLVNNAVQLLLDFAEHHPAINVMGGLLYWKDGGENGSCGFFGGYFSRIMWLLGKTVRSNLVYTSKQKRMFEADGYMYVDYVVGAHMFCQREYFNRFGGFDPEFFMYCEEEDLQKRMTDAGGKIVLTNGPKIIHLINASMQKKTSFFSKRCRLKSMLYYMRKHHSSASFAVFKQVVFAIEWLKSFKGVYSKDEYKNVLRMIRNA